MYKATVTPTNTQIFIPNYYVGKKIEVLVYTVDEITTDSNESNSAKRKPSDFVGCISKDKANQMLNDIDQSRDEWNRNI
jgi:hypothetical protein